MDSTYLGVTVHKRRSKAFVIKVLYCNYEISVRMSVSDCASLSLNKLARSALWTSRVDESTQSLISSHFRPPTRLASQFNSSVLIINL